MRSMVIILGGFVLLAVCMLVGRLIGGGGAMITGAKVFIPIWLCAALLNLWMGTRAGYSVGEELPIFLMIFALPAAAASFAWWRLS
jgi:hypothetical protein